MAGKACDTKNMQKNDKSICTFLNAQEQEDSFAQSRKTGGVLRTNRP
jgi:hypothetical protein